MIKKATATKRTYIQIKTSPDIKLIIIKLAEDNGFSNLTEYMLFVAQNARVRNDKSMELIKSQLQKSRAEKSDGEKQEQIQLRTNAKIKGFVKNKSKEFGFNTLTEYMLFVSLNAKIDVVL